MRILVTGRAGFIGSHYARTLLGRGFPGYEQAQVTVLDKLTYAGNLANLEPVADVPEEHFIASVLASRPLWGEEALAPCSYFPCLANWPATRVIHPKWFTVADIPRIQDALQKIASSADAAAKKLPNGGVPLYGRKFTSRHEPELLDKLEAALW
jgi:nucleoside-diphosphate-sugar epimerase